jgi:hypothetical protein
MKIKDRCIFCNKKLIACLTGFSGVKKDGSPILNVQIKDKIIKFKLSQTTASYDVKVNCSINTEDNEISFSSVRNPETTAMDQLFAEQAFDSFLPHIELYCPNKKCKYEYYLSSMPFAFSKDLQKIYPRRLFPLKMGMEAFHTKTLFIENDWTREELYIYSLDNENAKPIKSHMIDFTLSKPEQILNRVSMLVNFN